MEIIFHLFILSWSFAELKIIFIIICTLCTNGDFCHRVLIQDYIVVKGSPMNRGFLRSIHVEACHMCVILSSNYSLQNTDSTAPLFNDSRALLATLNINNMVSPAANHGPNSEVLKVLYSQSYQRQCSAISGWMFCNLRKTNTEFV